MPRRNPSPWLQGSCWFLGRHYHNPCPQSCQPLHYAFIQVITECSWEVYVSWYPETRKEDNHIADTWQTSLVYTRIPPFRCPTTHGYFFLEVKGIRPPVLTESQDRQSQNITHGYFLSGRSQEGKNHTDAGRISMKMSWRANKEFIARNFVKWNYGFSKDEESKFSQGKAWR